MDMVYRKKEKQQEKNKVKGHEIIIKIPFDNDLPERLKKISEQTGLFDYELLQKWTIQEESVINVLQNQGEKIRLTLKQDIEDQLASLFHKMRQTLEQTPDKKTEADKRLDESIGKDNPGERREALIREVAKLRKEGLTLTKIAEQFNTD
jgi:IS30 family transposase